MKNFLAMFRIPAAVMDGWSQVDPAEREKSEGPMRDAWRKWIEETGDALGQIMVGGKTKQVTSAGTEDTRNDIILYVPVEAESHEAAAKLFEHHPHLEIPQSSIEIMETRPMTGG